MKFQIWKELRVDKSLIESIYHGMKEDEEHKLKHWVKQYCFCGPQEGVQNVVRVQLGELGQYSPLTWRDTLSKIKDLGFEPFRIGTVPFLFSIVMDESVREKSYIITDWELHYETNPEFSSFILVPSKEKVTIKLVRTFYRGSKSRWEYDARYLRCYQRPKYHQGYPDEHLILRPDDYIVFIQP